MYTQEQILDMYFDRNQQAVSATTADVRSEASPGLQTR